MAPCERMNFSAAASSSPVVTPGRILPASRSIVLTRMAPAAAILSISAGDFLMIIGASESFFEAERGERRADVVVDLHLVARAVEAAQQARAPRSSRSAARSARGRSSRRFLTFSGSSSVALVERLAVLVAAALVLGRVELDVVEVAVRALAPAGQPLDHDLVRARRSAARRSAAGRASRAPRRARRPAATVRGKPSSRKPSSPSSSILSRIIAITRSSGTRPPLSMCSLACLPSSVPSSTCSRSRSPVPM